MSKKKRKEEDGYVLFAQDGKRVYFEYFVKNIKLMSFFLDLTDSSLLPCDFLIKVWSK